MALCLSDFDFFLPAELIAQSPAEPADSCRLMVLEKNSRKISGRIFTDIMEYLKPGDALVLNDTRVIAARLYAVREGHPDEKPSEIFLLKQIQPQIWEILGRPAKKLKPGTRLIFPAGRPATIRESLPGTRRLIQFEPETDVLRLAEEIGQMPIPPYIKNYPKSPAELKNDYQTVFARAPGATAAPTAGLHFTKSLLERIKNKGVAILYITLHTGLGTFQPIRAENVIDHQMAEEPVEISPETAAAINKVQMAGGKIWSVGTTVTRSLESAADPDGKIKPFLGATGLFIYPGYKFKIVDRLITNFHLPKSSLILLASALAGTEFLKESYRQALAEKYRFFSFGDSQLII